MFHKIKELVIMPARGGMEPTHEFDFYKEHIATITILPQFQDLNYSTRIGERLRNA
jgi:hypothetical protein